MPDQFRGDSGGHDACPRHHGFPKALCACAIFCPTPASAATSQTLAGLKSFFTTCATYLAAFGTLQRHEVAALALTLGVIFFAVVTAIALVRMRARSADEQAAARAEITLLRDELDRANALLLAEPQLAIVWSNRGGEPDMLGDPMLISASPLRTLAFGTWLPPEKARELEHAVEALRARGESFSMGLRTTAGRYLEAEGRAIGGRAVLRLKDVTGAKRDLANLSTHYQRLLSDVDTLKTLIEALPSPIWARDVAGRLTWVNAAYAHALEVRDGGDAVARNLELLDSAAREEVAHARAAGHTYSARVPVIVAGERRMLDVLDLPTRNGSAGIGLDASEAEAVRHELAHVVDAHRRTLDQLPTAVATFTADQRLTFYNTAYRVLWGLDVAFLDPGPTDAAVLDRLRAARKLPEQADFRAWKNALHEAYRAMEAREHLWHLPDGRTLRVITTPNPAGGVTYLFDDVTERLDLERRFDALIKVQGETLDNLNEGVAVFASDGRLRLSNPAFARMWKLPPSRLGERPHVEAVIAACKPLYAHAALWDKLRGAVTGLEHRECMSARLERDDGSVVDCVTVPLPDGATLVTFQDVTDSVNVERALRERNDALVAADELKNAFVHHVSYELRSPLTNIIGFVELLDDTTAGPLTAKQREYLGYITISSTALLTIINDILDLATIDAGAMTLDLGPVDIGKTVASAADGVGDRLVEHGISLAVEVPANVGEFIADERRVRQILYNLLSNAIGFSPRGEVITLAAVRRNDAIVFSVTDRGPGIPPDLRDRIFERFETHALGSHHRGAGLGLSIVRSLVELHGGTVRLESSVGRGTTVYCIFPVEHASRRAAAE
jgi:signal transduction histidine kinase